MTTQAFRKQIYRHFASHRRDFPWRRTKNPYHILVSEIMLQQTQTRRVIEKYKIFIRVFPSVRALAKAPFSKVLCVWQGLGYNRRAMYIWRSAKIICEQYYGKVPSDEKLLVSLPGIGENTAGAICAFAFNKPTVFIETNIRSVFIHFFFNGKQIVKDEDIRVFVQKTLDRKCPRKWYSALMDYGAMLKMEITNPNRISAHYKKHTPFIGSDRQVRGKIMRVLVSHIQLPKRILCKRVDISKSRFEKVIQLLLKDGLVQRIGNCFAIANS